MSVHNDGGPAFPGKLPIYGEVADAFAHFGGMTLRDYFAAKAMQSLLLDYAAAVREGLLPYRHDWMETSATSAYQMADAMLAARNALTRAITNGESV